jgi:hypothetical protein
LHKGVQPRCSALRFASLACGIQPLKDLLNAAGFTSLISFFTSAAIDERLPGKDA